LYAASEGKGPLRDQGAYVKLINIKEIGFEGRYWIKLDQNWVRRWAIMNTEMNIRFDSELIGFWTLSIVQYSKNSKN
jgi:hypothetical protein